MVLQPALPVYRLDFFRRMAAAFPGRFTVYASVAEMGALTEHAPAPWEISMPALRRPLPGLEWQPGALSIPFRHGDVLVVCGAPRNLSMLLLLLRARLTGVTTIWWGHYWSATTRPWRLLIRLLLMRLADQILFYTDEEVALYRTHARRANGRLVSAINNGLDIEPIRSVRAPYRAAERPSQLMFIGRLTQKARLDLLLESLCDPALQGVRLSVIGSGPEQWRLQTQAEALGVAPRIYWHGEITEEIGIAAVANHCRLFVYPGSVGLSLIHAMAYGLPAVLHDDRWTHMPEIAAFTDGLSGRCFPAGDATGLARTIASLLADRAALDAASTEALARVEKSYNTACMAERMIATIKGLIRRRAGDDRTTMRAS